MVEYFKTIYCVNKYAFAYVFNIVLGINNFCKFLLHFNTVEILGCVVYEAGILNCKIRSTRL